MLNIIEPWPVEGIFWWKFVVVVIPMSLQSFVVFKNWYGEELAK